VRIARGEVWIGRVIMAGAVIAAAVSFWQIQWAASLIGIPWLATWGFPVIVDGIGTVMAALTMSVHSRPWRQRLYVWSFFLVFVGISLFCNALHAVTYVAEHPISLPRDLEGMRWGIVFLLAAIPPVGAAIGMHAYAFTRRHGVGSDMRARPDEARMFDRRTHARTPDPSPPVHADGDGRAHGPAHAAPVRTRASQPRTGGAASGDAKWVRLLADPDGAAAWERYRRLRTETGERPSVKDVHAQSGVRRDRSTVSRWMAQFDAHWPADAQLPVHTGNGQAPTVHS
jgi:hypothetical protein